jgi:hypothetical protein
LIENTSDAYNSNPVMRAFELQPGGRLAEIAIIK